MLVYGGTPGCTQPSDGERWTERHLRELRPPWCSLGTGTPRRWPQAPDQGASSLGARSVVRSQMSTVPPHPPVLGTARVSPLTLQLSRGVVTVLVQIRLVQGKIRNLICILIFVAN